MISHTTERFRKALQRLPAPMRRRARRAYQRFSVNPHHPSLAFKRVHERRPIYAVRISQQYRALAVLEGEDLIWFWIGSHADYERMLK